MCRYDNEIGGRPVCVKIVWNNVVGFLWFCSHKTLNFRLSRLNISVRNQFVETWFKSSPKLCQFVQLYMYDVHENNTIKCYILWCTKWIILCTSSHVFYIYNQV